MRSARQRPHKNQAQKNRREAGSLCSAANLEAGSILRQVLGNAFWRSGHALVALLPVGWANFAMLFGELQGIDQTQQLIHIATQRQVIDDLRANNAFGIDQEGTAEGHTIGVLDVIGLADGMVDIGRQGVLDWADAALVHRGVTPGIVGKVRIDGNADHFDITRLELGNAVIQRNQFGRADKGEVQRVEKNQAVFALDRRGQAKAVDDFAIAQHRCNVKIRGLLTYEYAHSRSP